MGNPKCSECGTKMVHHHTEVYEGHGIHLKHQYFECPNCVPATKDKEE